MHGDHDDFRGISPQNWPCLYLRKYLGAASKRYLQIRHLSHLKKGTYIDINFAESGFEIIRDAVLGARLAQGQHRKPLQ